MRRKSVAVLLFALFLSAGAGAQGRSGEPPEGSRQPPIVRIIRFIGSILGFEPTPPHP